MKLIRVFPRKTKATPRDTLAYFADPARGRSAEPDLYVEADEVHVSVSFTWDRAEAERLARLWKRIAPVKIGGVGWRSPEFPHGDPGAEFVPGRYVREGYLFTSRGCPRRCWFCSVHLRDPEARLLPIQDGWNILDDNLLACPRHHVEAVFAMLRRQKRRVCFTGGLEARSLEDYQVGLLADLKPAPAMFWAYDPGDAYETLASASRRLIAAGFRPSSHRLQCYVLIGYSYPNDPTHRIRDTFDKAEKRLNDMKALGFTPYAMLYRPEGDGSENWRPDPEWKTFQRAWMRPAIIHASNKNATG